MGLYHDSESQNSFVIGLSNLNRIVFVKRGTKFLLHMLIFTFKSCLPALRSVMLGVSIGEGFRFNPNAKRDHSSDRVDVN